MKRLVDLVKLDYLDSLIRRQMTGTPNDLANRLKISIRNVHELIAFMQKEMQAPLRYSKCKSSYIYDYPPDFYLGFERDSLRPNNADHVYGGMNYDNLLPDKRVKEDNVDFDDSDINNN